MATILRSRRDELREALARVVRSPSSKAFQENLARELIAALHPFSRGSGAPVEPVQPVSSVGDLYCDDTTGQLWSYKPSGWEMVGSGTSGGAQVDVGASLPAVGSAGSMFLRLSDNTTWISDGSSWLPVGPGLQGPQGPVGPQGPPGVDGSALLAMNAVVSTNDQVGQLVGALEDGTMSAVSALYSTNMPAIGVIISKSSATAAVVQYGGVVTIFGNLLPGSRYYVGTDGFPSLVPFEQTGHLYYQSIGRALSDTTLLLTPSPDFTGAFQTVASVGLPHVTV